MRPRLVRGSEQHNIAKIPAIRHADLFEGCAVLPYCFSTTIRIMAVDDNAPSRSSTPPSHAMEKHSLEGQKHELPQEELDQDTTDDDANQNIPDYPTGLSLFLIIAGITVVMLLAMLDISIISTVRCLSERSSFAFV